MYIDEAGRQDLARRVQVAARGLAVKVADRGDAVVLDADVRPAPGLPGAVDDLRALDLEVEHGLDGRSLRERERPLAPGGNTEEARRRPRGLHELDRVGKPRRGDPTGQGDRRNARVAPGRAEGAVAGRAEPGRRRYAGAVGDKSASCASRSGIASS